MCATHLQVESGPMTKIFSESPGQRRQAEPDQAGDERLTEAAELRLQASELLARLDRLIAQLQRAESPERRGGE